MIDDIDRMILTILQDNARISNAEIARRVEMAPSAIYERIRKLEERGVILGTGHASTRPRWIWDCWRMSWCERTRGRARSTRCGRRGRRSCSRR